MLLSPLATTPPCPGSGTLSSIARATHSRPSYNRHVVSRTSAARSDGSRARRPGTLDVRGTAYGRYLDAQIIACHCTMLPPARRHGCQLDISFCADLGWPSERTARLETAELVPLATGPQPFFALRFCGSWQLRQSSLTSRRSKFSAFEAAVGKEIVRDRLAQSE
jgi:hypothetical protein